ncbi:MAG: tRNA adenosine(34) deaminase TadA [Candidatus Omnitrophota bacterium]
MNIHEEYMAQALREAQKAYESDEVPVGAVIVRDGEIIARAHNQIKLLKDPTAHAEMIAITQAAAYLENERLTGCELYVTLEPCSMCVGAAVLARLNKIVFGTTDPKTGACGSVVSLTKPGLFNHDIEVAGGVMEDVCCDLMRRFFASKR